jgi:hypothetical protein
MFNKIGKNIFVANLVPSFQSSRLYTWDVSNPTFAMDYLNGLQNILRFKGWSSVHKMYGFKYPTISFCISANAKSFVFCYCFFLEYNE